MKDRRLKIAAFVMVMLLSFCVSNVLSRVYHSAHTQQADITSGTAFIATVPIIGTDYRNLSLSGDPRTYHCPLAVAGCDRVLPSDELTLSFEHDGTADVVRTLTFIGSIDTQVISSTGLAAIRPQR